MPIQRSGGREITAATKLTAIFGDPVEHSLSPAMHNAAYAALKINRVYVAFRVTADALPIALAALGSLGIVAVNLTVPLKEHAAELLGHLSPEARTLGAVNCVINRHGRLLGDNTDARGLERDLRAVQVQPSGRQVIVIGAGGGAAAAVLTCIRMRAGRIVIANRTLERGRALAGRFASAGAAKIDARGLDALADRALLADTRLIINATPMGLTTRRFARLDYAATPRDCVFYDMLYASTPTAFLKPAMRLGRRTADGAGMLVAQGELAFKLFNGIAPPRSVMRTALWSKLRRAK
jgi:shikimate dehydrogenase